MQSFKNVEQVRHAYHQDSTLNSVHRSSLLVPELPSCEASISFVNHFLLKRGYKRIACRITAVDVAGELIEARAVPIEEPRVYTFVLGELFPKPAETYLVEFYSVDNLFIPFPAVIVNHRGETFLNSVHSYNRILNDVFEDDRINRLQVREASIDVRVDAETDTFVVFSSGLQPVDSQLRVELTANGKRLETSVPVSLPRLNNVTLSLKTLFPGLECPVGSAVLKVDQPRQFMFYGRLFCGIQKAAGTFSANHSYYDNSANEEYWDDARPSFAAYPYIPRFQNRIRMYPIMSPGTLDLSVGIHDKTGAELARPAIGRLASPGGAYVEASVTDVVTELGFDPDDIAAFCLYATPAAGCTPTRVNHQLVYDHGQLACSINASLANDNVFVPPTKTGRTWSQTVVGGGYNSWLAFYGQDPKAVADTIELALYDAKGRIGVHHYQLPACGSAVIDMVDLVGEADAPRFVWFMAQAKRPDLKAIVVSENLESRHCSGEHGF